MYNLGYITSNLGFDVLNTFSPTPTSQAVDDCKSLFTAYGAVRDGLQPPRTSPTGQRYFKWLHIYRSVLRECHEVVKDVRANPFIPDPPGWQALQFNHGIVGYAALLSIEPKPGYQQSTVAFAAWDEGWASGRSG
jgi:hypothetical protein